VIHARSLRQPITLRGKPVRKPRAALAGVCASLALGAGAIGLSVMTAPSAAVAQGFSKAYKFLEAIRNQDGAAVNDALSDPGSTLVNTHDVTTGETALIIVTKRRDLGWMGFLISRGADTNGHDNRGQTPLTLAASLGFVEGVQLLLDHGASPDEANDTGETPLIAAVHRRDLPLIRALIAGGANLDRADSSGRSARDYATLYGPGNSVSALIDSLGKTDKPRGPTYGPTL